MRISDRLRRLSDILEKLRGAEEALNELAVFIDARPGKDCRALFQTAKSQVGLAIAQLAQYCPVSSFSICYVLCLQLQIFRGLLLHRQTIETLISVSLATQTAAVTAHFLSLRSTAPWARGLALSSRDSLTLSEKWVSWWFRYVRCHTYTHAHTDTKQNRTGLRSPAAS